MRLEDDDQAFLWDMREAASDISRTVLELSADEFASNKFTRLAVERLAIILGEAAAKVSESYRLAHGEIDWRRIQRLRNSMAHEYGSRLALGFYRTCREFVVPLSLQLDTLCPQPPTEGL
ncbi:MAG: DUF86 domain-containing protein [Candidatus Eremiobacteraeota bacterium]|nr:DUF86 domain-containing protein [Candidatus Eremiobacteraeota bacterium]